MDLILDVYYCIYLRIYTTNGYSLLHATSTVVALFMGQGLLTTKINISCNTVLSAIRESNEHILFKSVRVIYLFHDLRTRLHGQ